MSEAAVRDDFVIKMGEACDVALDRGEITRLQKFRLMARLKFPRQREAVRKIVETELVMEGYQIQGIIDWENLDIEKLVQLMEAIMKLIEFIAELS